MNFNSTVKKLVRFFSGIRVGGGMFAIGVPHSFARGRYESILAEVKFGSIIGRKTEGYLTGLVAGKRISHVGIYVGPYRHYSHAVIHADSDSGRVVLDELYLFIDASYIEVWNRRGDVKYQDCITMTMRVDQCVGKEYDFEFSSDEERLYCTELVHRVYGGLGVTFKVSRSWWGGKILKPDEFIDEKDFCKVYECKDE